MADSNTQNIELKKMGRPTKIDDECITNLESVFKLAVTDRTACNYVGISTKAFYERYNKDEDFRNKMDRARDYGRLAAGNVVIDAIAKQKDVATARWWLEKKHPDEFQPLKENERPNITNNLNIMGDEALAQFLYGFVKDLSGNSKESQSDANGGENTALPEGSTG